MIIACIFRSVVINYLQQQIIEHKLIDLIQHFSWQDRFPSTAFECLLALLRDFIIIGGMPEAISTFISGNSIDDVIDVHLSIIETYQDDFSKYARHSHLAMIQRVFNYVPKALGQKVKYTNIDSDRQARDVKTAIDLLLKAGVIIKAGCTNASGLPLGAEEKHKVYKLYFLDVGLVNTMCGTKHLSLETIRNARFINEGNIAEQFIAQHLLYSGRPNATPELFYWLREAKSKNAEVDFLTSIDSKIIPVEVKAGKSGSLKSLHQFSGLKNSDNALRFDLNCPSRQHVTAGLPNSGNKCQFNLISLPLFMVNRIDLCNQ